MFANPFINFCARIYNWFIWTGENLHSIFLLLIRIIWGHQFIYTGFGKLLNLDKVTRFFETLGVPHPEFNAVLVGVVELVCGLFILVGFASRMAAIPLIIIMVTAIGYAHSHVFHDLKFIADPSNLVREAPFPFLMAAVIIFIFGPGRISIDGWIKRVSRNWRKY